MAFLFPFMRFPLAWAYTALDCLLRHSWISEAKLEISLSPTSPPLMYWNNKVAAIGTSCITLWYGMGTYSCTCSRLNEPSEHFLRLCEHQKVFMKISWARKFVFASQSQEGRSRRVFCIWFWGSEGYLFHCSYGSFFVLSNDVKRCTPHGIRARCTFGLAHQIHILFYVQSHTVFLNAMLILKTSSFVFLHPHS